MRGIFNSDTSPIPTDATLQSALKLRDGRMFWTQCRTQHWTILEYLTATEPDFRPTDVTEAGWLQNGLYTDDYTGYTMQCIREYMKGE